MPTPSVPARLEPYLGACSTINAGEAVFRQGEHVRAVHLITSGLIMTRTARLGQEVLTSIRPRGWPLGVVPAITTRIYATTAVALRTSTIRALALEDFVALRASHRDVDAWLVDVLAREAFDLSDRVACLVASDSLGRLEYLLIELFRADGHWRSDGSVRLRVAPSVTKLATFLPASRQWTSDLLSKLAHERVLVRDKGWFVVPRDSPLVERLRKPKESHDG